MTGRWFAVGDDFEAAARRAVAEEAGERARMEAAGDVRRVPVGRLELTERQPEPSEPEHPELAPRLALSHRQAEAIEGLHRELAARLALIERQGAALGEARAVFMLLMGSWPYRVLRVLGRWGWLERRIFRTLRS